jgi:hypothetical protein
LASNALNVTVGAARDEVSPMKMPTWRRGELKLAVTSDCPPNSRSAEKHEPELKTLLPEFAGAPTFAICGARVSTLVAGPSVTPRATY